VDSSFKGGFGLREAKVSVIVNCSLEKECCDDCSNCDVLLDFLNKKAGNYTNYGMLNVVSISKKEVEA
jgi:hypothetical protein